MSDLKLIIIVLLLVLLLTISLILTIKKYEAKNKTELNLKKIAKLNDENEKPFNKIETLIITLIFVPLITSITFFLRSEMIPYSKPIIIIQSGMTIGLLFKVFFMNTKVTMQELMTYCAIVFGFAIFIGYFFITIIDETIGYTILFFSFFLISIFCGIINIAKKLKFLF